MREETIQGLTDELKQNKEKIDTLEAMLRKTTTRQNECRLEMINMVKKIIKLQDEIKEAITLHHSSPRARGKRANTFTITVSTPE